MSKYQCVSDSGSSGTADKTSSRSLRWDMNFGQADLTAHFSRDYEIQVTGFMMAILLQFNHHRVMSFEQIRQATLIQPEHEL